MHKIKLKQNVQISFFFCFTLTLEHAQIYNYSILSITFTKKKKIKLDHTERVSDSSIVLATEKKILKLKKIYIHQFDITSECLRGPATR